jgi:hypothetical protein
MNDDELEEVFGLNKKKKNKLNQPPKILDKLLQPAKKDKGVNMPHFQPRAKNTVQQADLLFLPDDNGKKYALVVIDVGSRLVDSEPLANKDASSVLAAFKKIYARKIIEIPKQIEVDPGTEFKGVVAKWFADKKVFVRVGKTARHRQQALAERANQTIGTALHRRMTAEELLTGETSRKWTEDLPKLVKLLNKRAANRKPGKWPDDPVCNGDSCNALDIGTKVRVMNEAPTDPITGQSLPGKFRSTDIRWNVKPRVIRDILLKPGYPPLYFLDGPIGKNKIEPITYTKNQLQVIHDNEQYPDLKVIRGKPATYRVEKIIDKKRIKNRIYYTIKWFGVPKTTLEPRTELIKDVPQLVRDFDNNNK